MIRIPMQGPPYYDWGLDRWKIGIALVLFAVLMIWLLNAPASAPASAPGLSDPAPTPVPIAMNQPEPGTVDVGAALQFVGTAPAGSQVLVKDGDRGELGTTLADADGRWRVDTGQTWTAGAYQLQAVVRDAATGEILGRSGTIPVVALSSPLSALELRGQSLDMDGDQGTLVLAGVAPPGLNVSAAWMENGRPVPLGQTQADGAGDWVIQAPAPPQQDFDLLLTARDPTGDVVTTSDLLRLTVASSTSGPATVTVNETAAPDGTAQVGEAGPESAATETITETIPETITETVMLPLASGPADAPSVEMPTVPSSVPPSVPSTTVPLTEPSTAAAYPPPVDTPAVGSADMPTTDVPADVPTDMSPLSSLTLGLDGLGPGSRILAGQVDRLTGTGAPNSVVQVMGRYLPAGEPVADGATLPDTVPETILGAAPVDGTGRWQLDLAAPLAWGRHELTLLQLGVEGETTAQIGPITLHALAPDTTFSPAPPVILVPAVNGRISGTDSQFAGTALAGSQVRLQIMPAPEEAPLSVALAWVTNRGEWSVRLGEQLPDGTYWAQAIALDPAGAEAGRSQPVPFVVDSLSSVQMAPPPTVEPVPTVASLPPAGATATPLPDSVTEAAKADAQPTWSPSPVTVYTRLPRFVGQAAPGRQLLVRVTDSLGQTQQAIVGADGTGQWSFVPAMPLSVGETQATVQVLDQSGTVRSGLVVRVAPQAELSGSAATRLQLMSPMPGLLANRLPPIWGLSLPGSFVTVRLDAEIIASVQADGQGYWFAALPAPLADGTVQLTVSASPAAGQREPTEQLGPIALNVVADTPTLLQPVIDTPDDRADTARFVVAGMAQPGQQVVIVVNGVAEATVVADASGRWRWQVAHAQAEGPVYLQARTLDEAGNVLTESPVQVVVFFVPLGG